jgi:hypothetical protein
VFADDIVSKLSYGSMMDVKELIIASNEAAKKLTASEILWSGIPEGDKWKDVFDQIEQVRKRCLDNSENPRVSDIHIYLSYILVINQIYTVIRCRKNISVLVGKEYLH